MVVPKIFMLVFLGLLLLILMVITVQLHVEYSEVNKLESRLTSEIRHPQHITHSRYLIRTNKITNYKCIVKIEGLPKAAHSGMGMAPCSEVKWWKFYK